MSDLDQLLSVMQGRLYLEKFFSDFLIVSLKNQHTGILKKLLMTVGKLSLSKLFTKKKEVIPQVLFCKGKLIMQHIRYSPSMRENDQRNH